MTRISIISAAVAALVLVAPAVQALTMTTEVTSGTPAALDIGDTFTVDYFSNDFPEFTAAELNLTYDPSIISVTKVTYGSFFLTKTQSEAKGTVDTVTGLLTRVLEFSRFFDPAVSGDVFLFTIEGTALADGNTSLVVAESHIGFAKGTKMLVEDVAPAQIEVTVGISAVPLPATLPLLMAGFAGLVGLRRRAQG